MNRDRDLTSEPLTFARALADETRQEIMRLCCCRWLSVHEIVDALQVTQPTVSHHLAVLREANLVHVRRKGRETFYQLNQERVALCCGKVMIRYAPDIDTSDLELHSEA
ncbi:MAG: metalloregulator ArsR/SmtB family transcription factor [Anaerolineales bacterium]|jgi:ArsR family transcriptional regulator